MNIISSETVQILNTFISTMLGVFVGGIMTYRLNLKFQSKVINKQARLDEIKAILVDICLTTDQLLMLRANYMVSHDVKKRHKDILVHLNTCHDHIKSLVNKLYLCKLLLKDYKISHGEIRKEFWEIANVIEYKLSGCDSSIDEFEEYIEERSIEKRIEDLENKLKKHTEELQKEYITGL